MKKVVVLGSTGSIGTSTLSIVRSFPDRFTLLGVSGHSNIGALRAIAEEFNPRYVALSADAALWHEYKPQDWSGELLEGESSLCALAEHPEADLVVAAITGIAGLRPVEAALRAGKKVLLANKEALVCAGKILTDLERTHGGTLIPADSEHSAIFQLLSGRAHRDLESITLTASGGPFRTSKIEDLGAVTPAQAVNHPRWSMGAKISIDSATLVNKALELIEAAWLFSLNEEKIGIVIHPESIVHSLVTFLDRTQFAHMSVPDMRGALGFGMIYPDERLPQLMAPLALDALGSLTFERLDDLRFPAPKLARSCLRSGGAACAVFNSANECAVARFMKGKIRFIDIVPAIERALTRFSSTHCDSVDSLLQLHKEIELFFGMATAQ